MSVWYTPDCGHRHLVENGTVHTVCPLLVRRAADQTLPTATSDLHEVLSEAIRRAFAHPDQRLDDRFETYASAQEMADEIIAECRAMNQLLRLDAR